MTEKQVVAQLSFFVRCSGGQRAWAQANGFSASYVNDVLLGRRKPSAKICRAIGIRRDVVFLSKAKSKPSADTTKE